MSGFSNLLLYIEGIIIEWHGSGMYGYYYNGIILYERIWTGVFAYMRNSKDECLHERISDLFRNEIEIVPERKKKVVG